MTLQCSVCGISAVNEMKEFTTKAIPDNAYAITEFADEQSEEYCCGVKAHGCVELCIMGGKNTLPIRKN